jgi:hypothetical protein
MKESSKIRKIEHLDYIRECTFTPTKDITAWQLWQYLAWRDEYRQKRARHYSKLKLYQFDDSFYAFKITIDDIPESIREFFQLEYFKIPNSPKNKAWYRKLI